jgi:hypothetical protein
MATWGRHQAMVAVQNPEILCLVDSDSYEESEQGCLGSSLGDYIGLPLCLDNIGLQSNASALPF